jgi:hypothetical protein
LRFANQESMRRLNLAKSVAGIFSALTAAIFAYCRFESKWRGLQSAVSGTLL